MPSGWQLARHNYGGAPPNSWVGATARSPDALANAGDFGNGPSPQLGIGECRGIALPPGRNLQIMSRAKWGSPPNSWVGTTARSASEPQCYALKVAEHSQRRRQRHGKTATSEVIGGQAEDSPRPSNLQPDPSAKARTSEGSLHCNGAKHPWQKACTSEAGSTGPTPTSCTRPQCQ